MNSAFRLMYVAKFPETVYVLHAFQKKTRATARKDLALAQYGGLRQRASAADALAA
jgi:phage-related protein